MILEYVYGAAAQLARFVGRFPAAWNWSVTAPVETPAGLVCGTAAVSAAVTGTAAISPAVTGTPAVEEC